MEAKKFPRFRAHKKNLLTDHDHILMMLTKPKALQSRNSASAGPSRRRKGKTYTIDDVVKMVSFIAGAPCEVDIVK
jgi:hypothetical protein